MLINTVCVEGRGPFTPRMPVLRKHQTGLHICLCLLCFSCLLLHRAYHQLGCIKFGPTLYFDVIVDLLAGLILLSRSYSI